ncbi:serine hydrolase [Chryseobacterium sp. T16E-39]|uniref:serine hydrolase domain-containing protein n=1 Tax=Chryseobacterium sp. T16E-39 TaxID=2015076 RepID=UPI000B5B2796|nr:serine hydrolase [Chryseobacterium sp. T16E-39]ASK28714.1 serine hydrolase [Chryseobacterium sp. T16E-39]
MKNIILLCTIFLAFVQKANAQNNLSSPSDSGSELYSENIGKIAFLSSFKNAKQIKENDLIKKYTLTNKSDLSFIAFFDHPLTTYKSKLSPNIVKDSLFRKGNYQFTLWIDNKEIYKSNLLPGAPYQKVQDTAVVLNRPLINNTNGQGSWSESFWNRFMANGGEEALKDGQHHLRMEIRAYVHINNETKVSPVLAKGELILQVLRHPKIDINSILLNKPTPYEGLEVSSKKFNENKIKELKGSIDEGIFKQINSIVVINDGKIQIEEYFNGENRSTLHDPRSVGKSFASTLMGIAIGDHFIKDENQKLDAFYNLQSYQFSSGKDNATIKELLTMSSGFDGDDGNENSPGNEENMYPTNNWVDFTMNLPYNPALKNNWHYFTAGVIVLGDIINQSVPSSLEKFAEEKLFHPLGIKNYKWQYTPQNIPNTAGSIQMNALDFAKYGQLYKNNGIWNGKQIIPQDWVKKTLTKQVKIQDRKDEYYSYLFWNKTFDTGSKKVEAFYCAGNGGNYILIFKDQPLVIVITASAYGQNYAHPQVAKMLEKYILPAVL